MAEVLPRNRSGAAQIIMEYNVLIECIQSELLPVEYFFLDIPEHECLLPDGMQPRVLLGFGLKVFKSIGKDYVGILVANPVRIFEPGPLDDGQGKLALRVQHRRNRVHIMPNQLG